MTCVLYLALYLNPLVSAISTAHFHKRFGVSINKFYRVIDRRNTCSILITLLESEYEKKQQEHSYRSLTFSRRSTSKYTTKPVGKILDKLAIVFEAETAFKAALYSLLTLNHLSSAK